MNVTTSMNVVTVVTTAFPEQNLLYALKYRNSFWDRLLLCPRPSNSNLLKSAQLLSANENDMTTFGQVKTA